MGKKTVAVIGAGVVGVSTAYALARNGYNVIVVDARSDAGRGASAGNAAQLSYAYGDAMSSPALMRQLPAVFLNRDPAMRAKLQLSPHFLLWGMRFLLNGTQARWRANTRSILELADLSRREMEALLPLVDLDFSFRPAGKLHLFADDEGFARARAGVEMKRGLGLVQHMISRDAAIGIEPALQGFKSPIAGAIHTPADAVGDAAAYCRNLLAHIEKQYGVTVLWGAQVTGFETNTGALRSVTFKERQNLLVDKAVLAAGPEAIALAGSVAETRKIWPVRGYSLTIPRPENAPQVSLTDVKRKLAFASIGNRFRVAGLADVVPVEHGFAHERFRVLQQSACEVFPDLFAQNAEGGSQWSGTRPMTPSSVPIIQRSKHIEGLYLNLGHGMLGWTLALGAARTIADMFVHDHE